MKQLANITFLKVRQEKEWVEIFTRFETRNKYSIFSENNKKIYSAAEEKGSFITACMRVFFKAFRPFTIDVIEGNSTIVLKLRKPFCFYFHYIEVLDVQGNFLGKIQRRFSILRKKYSIFDSVGQEKYKLIGPIFHPWTFKVLKNGKECGKILKKWSGLLKETATDVDNFGIKFDPDLDVKDKHVLLGAVFLIDIVYFEK